LEPGPGESAVKRVKILLVQDARTQGNSTKRFLEHDGHTVVWAGSGMSALLAAGKHRIDLILIDLSLPDIDGTELCQRFRLRRDSSGIPIIIFTAQETSAGVFRRRSDGPDGYLAKPFSEEQLKAKIATVLAGRSDSTVDDRTAQGAAQPPEPAPLQKQSAAPAQMPTAGAAVRTEPQRSTVPAPRSALKPRPEPRTIPEVASRPAAKPVLRLVPKPQPATAETVPPLAEEAVSQRLEAAPFTMPAHEVVDPSTGLFSRSQFEAMFGKEFKRAVRFKQQMSCMLIDLDGSAMGRTADEDLVKAVIGVVQRTIREVDTAAWWTGGALIVLLPNTMRNDAVQAGVRVLEAVAEHPFTWPDATKVTVSIGVAGLPDRKLDSEQKMIEAAAAACKRARETMHKQPRTRPAGGKP